MAVNVNKTGGAFQPFERQKYAVPAPAASAAAATSSTTSGSGGARSGSSGCDGDGDDTKEKEKDMADKEKDKQYKDKEDQSQSHRKTRRCWSPELHRRFLHALQQLGGSHGEPDFERSHCCILSNRLQLVVPFIKLPNDMYLKL